MLATLLRQSAGAKSSPTRPRRVILGFMDRQGLKIGSRRLTDTKLPPLQPPWLWLKQERPGSQSREVIPLEVMTMICSTSRRFGNTYWNTDEFVDFISCNTYMYHPSVSCAGAHVQGLYRPIYVLSRVRSPRATWLSAYTVAVRRRGNP